MTTMPVPSELSDFNDYRVCFDREQEVFVDVLAWDRSDAVAIALRKKFGEGAEWRGDSDIHLSSMGFGMVVSRWGDSWNVELRGRLRVVDAGVADDESVEDYGAGFAAALRDAKNQLQQRWFEFLPGDGQRVALNAGGRITYLDEDCHVWRYRERDIPWSVFCRLDNAEAARVAQHLGVSLRSLNERNPHITDLPAWRERWDATHGASA